MLILEIVVHSDDVKWPRFTWNFVAYKSQHIYSLHIRIYTQKKLISWVDQFIIEANVLKVVSCMLHILC